MKYGRNQAKKPKISMGYGVFNVIFATEIDQEVGPITRKNAKITPS